MITKKQKTNFVVLSIISIILGLIAIVPFTTLFNRLGLKVESVKSFELVVKLIDLPIVILLFEYYAVKLLNKQLKAETKYSVSTVKMSFFPAVVYLTGLLAWAVGIVYVSGTLSKSIKASLAVLVFICGAVVLNLIFGLFTNWITRLTRKGIKTVNYLFPILFLLIIVAVYVVYDATPVINVLSSKWAMLEMVVCLAASGIVLLTLFKSIFSDRTEKIILGKKESLTKEQEDQIIDEEVLNDLHAGFIAYYQAGKGTFNDQKVVEEVKEPETEEKVEEEVKEVETEEKVEEEVKEETPVEEEGGNKDEK